MIAEDVIKQVKAKVYRVETGRYVDIDYLYNTNDNMWSADVRENFDVIVNCRVCALGSCLLSATKFKNELTFRDVKSPDDNEKTTEFLKSIFPPEQLSLIENAFECGLTSPWSDEMMDERVVDNVKDATRFGKRYSNPKNRLIAIMKNVIANKGVFRP